MMGPKHCPNSIIAVFVAMFCIALTSAKAVDLDRAEHQAVRKKGERFVVFANEERTSKTLRASLAGVMREIRKEAANQLLIAVELGEKRRAKGERGAAEALLARIGDKQEEITGIVEIVMTHKPGAKKGDLTVALELFHKPFPAMGAEHLRSPEYTFKCGADSALLGSSVYAVGMDESRWRHDLRLASEMNRYLPDSLREKMVIVRIETARPLSQAQRQGLAREIAWGMRRFRDSQDYGVIGFVPRELLDKVKKTSPVLVKVYKHIYDNEPPNYYATAAEKRARTEKLKPQLMQSVGVAPSGCFAVFGLERTTPYHYEVCTEGTGGKADVLTEGDFFTASVAGTMRTVPNKIKGYQPLSPSTYETPPLSLSGQAEPPVNAATEFDYVIEGATIIDGSNAPRFVGDVGIIGEKIRRIGNLAGAKRCRTIDAHGFTLTPGFIDIHTHADRAIGENPQVREYVQQGVTTVLGGNCGFSPLGIGAFLQDLETTGVAVNFATLFGNRPARVMVAGWTDRMATCDEIYRMKEMVDLAMEEGAFGLSTGLIYRGSENAFTLEIGELAKQVAPYGGFYASHIRGETDEVLDAAREAIFIGELAEVPVQISHVKVIARRNWGKMPRYLGYIEEARLRRGIEVLGDQYPYRATGASHDYRLYSLIQRRAIKDNTPEVVMFRNLPEEYRRWEGRLLSDVMKEENKSAEEIIQMLGLTPESKYYGVYICLGEEDLKAAIASPLIMVCSDSGVLSARALAKGDYSDYHPRTFSTFAEFFGTYVRQKGYCSWELGVYKCTGLPARRLGLRDLPDGEAGRGMIRENYYADIAIFDPQEFGARNNYTTPDVPPAGMKYVFVNGALALDNGAPTGRLCGKVLRGTEQF
jgi:N-acyl-D-amino-acid deacylase